jgi:hypothetical protein
MHGQVPPVRGNAALFLTADECRRADALLAAALDGLPGRIAEGPMTPTLDFSQFHDELENSISWRRRHWKP